MNPDKTKKETEEFKRIGERKDDLLLQYPTTDPQNPIVTSRKGVLKGNGTEVVRYNSALSLLLRGSCVNNTAFNICFWNIDGRWTFFKDDKIIKWIKQFNIILLAETPFTKGQLFNNPGYKPYPIKFSDVTDRKSRWNIFLYFQ